MGCGRQATNPFTSAIMVCSPRQMMPFLRERPPSRILVSADVDFGTLLVVSQTKGPSVILFRRAPRKPGAQLTLLLSNLPVIAEPLAKGSIVVIERTRIRVRELPIF
jgi:hypothetical protein